MSDWLQYRRKYRSSSFKLLELIGRIGDGQCGIISAYDKQLTAYQNKFMYEKLFYKLLRPGWSVSEVRGVCAENNRLVKRKFYFVYAYPHSKLQNLRSVLIQTGSEFNQDKVLYISSTGAFEFINPQNRTSKSTSVDKETLLYKNNKLPFYLTTANLYEASPNVLDMGIYLPILHKLEQEKIDDIKYIGKQN